MKSIATILFALLALDILSVEAGELCPVCRSQLVDVTTQTDDASKPSRNLSVWNRSSCANMFFGQGSWICPRDGYAYEAQMKQWELSLEDRDAFALPLDRSIYGFPLPDGKRIKSRTVYSQEFSTLESVKHGLLFWTVIDEQYFDKIRQYTKKNGLILEIEPHADRGEAIIRTHLIKKKTEQDAPSNR